MFEKCTTIKYNVVFLCVVKRRYGRYRSFVYVHCPTVNENSIYVSQSYVKHTTRLLFLLLSQTTRVFDIHCIMRLGSIFCVSLDTKYVPVINFLSFSLQTFRFEDAWPRITVSPIVTTLVSHVFTLHSRGAHNGHTVCVGPIRTTVHCTRHVQLRAKHDNIYILLSMFTLLLLLLFITFFFLLLENTDINATTRRP